MNTTLYFYEKNAEQFAENTQRVDFRDVQERFLQKLTPGAKILDFGCGAGRDTKYFLVRGFDVDAADGSEEMCRIAGAYAGIAVKRMLFQELDEREAYDGIWACSSILHLPKAELGDVLERMRRAVKAGGVIYVSFKHGAFEGMRSGRYFTDFTAETFADFMKDHANLRIEECWITGDARPGRSEERWLNLILRRETDQAGEESNQAGEESNQAEKETSQAGREANQAEKETSQVRKEADQPGKKRIRQENEK